MATITYNNNDIRMSVKADGKIHDILLSDIAKAYFPDISLVYPARNIRNRRTTRGFHAYLVDFMDSDNVSITYPQLRNALSEYDYLLERGRYFTLIFRDGEFEPILCSLDKSIEGLLVSLNKAFKKNKEDDYFGLMIFHASGRVSFMISREMVQLVHRKKIGWMQFFRTALNSKKTNNVSHLKCDY